MRIYSDLLMDYLHDVEFISFEDASIRNVTLDKEKVHYTIHYYDERSDKQDYVELYHLLQYIYNNLIKTNEFSGE